MKKFLSSDSLHIIIVFLFSVFFIFYKLGSTHLIEFDEGIYALVAKNILKEGDWFTLHWRLSSAWFDKGPLYLWLTAILLKLFGQSALVVRLTSSLFGLIGIISVYLIGKKIYNARIGFMSALILASNAGYLAYARLGMLDVPNAALNSLSLYLLLEGLERPFFWYPAAVILALGFLNRQLLALLGLSAFGLFWLANKKRSGINWRELVGPFLVFLAIVLPWHLIESLKFGKDFWEVYFFHQTVSRFAQTIEGKSAPLFWYVTVARVHLRIWILVLIPALFLFVYKAVFKAEQPARLVIIWSGLTFLAFTLAQSKLIWYIMPLYPPLSLIIGGFISEIFEKFKIGKLAPWVILLAAGIFNFINWPRIQPRDFNYDQAKVIEYKNSIDPKAGLLSVGYGYSVSQFYSNGEVTPIPKEEMKGFFDALNYKYAIITLGDLNSLPDKDRYQIVYTTGDGALISKTVK